MCFGLIFILAYKWSTNFSAIAKQAPLKMTYTLRGTFFQASGIWKDSNSPVEVYKKIGKFVFSVCKTEAP